MKKYSIMYGIGKCKYVVNYCNGKKYDDDSNFYDIRIFTNKQKMEKFVKKLKKEGFIYG